MPRTRTLEEATEAFWKKVIRAAEDECWLWIGHRHRQGYGMMRWQGRETYTHRVSYELANGKFPHELDVLHTCDNPPCVNPRHLFLGTALDNARDMHRKGRANPPRMHGERHGMHKLTNEKVAEIRRRHAVGDVSFSQLAREFGVSLTTVWNVVNEKSWRVE